MPELPDVETVRRHLLSEGLVGRKITGTEILWSKAIRVPDVEGFTLGVTGSTVADIRRRAKYLVVDLQGEISQTLILHLRMTGSLHVLASGAEQPRYARNTLFFEDGSQLCFVDPRKFGMMWLVQDEMDVLGGLGPEPLSVEFTAEILAASLAAKGGPIKAILCDQRVIAGIGNLYADEVLHEAGIHPLERGRDLPLDRVEVLHRSIVSKLTAATERLAPLFPKVWLPNSGEEGFDVFVVPRKEGTPCPLCAVPVARISVGGRTSYYCPGCQKRELAAD